MNKSIYLSLVLYLSVFNINNTLASDNNYYDEVAYNKTEDEAQLRQYIEFEKRANKKEPEFVQIQAEDDQYIVDKNNLPGFNTDSLPDSPLSIRKYYQNNINQCMELYKDELDITRSVLSTSNKYSATADITNVFANINQCYENIGYQIIGHLYGGTQEAYSKFAKEAQSYYIKASDVNFNPIYCEDTCSLEALVSAQIQKFADFRVYLNKLVEAKISGK